LQETLKYSDDSPSALPLVSVGIPTYNRPYGLQRTLNCITQQTYRNLEIIVSDNCSTDPEIDVIVRNFISKDCRIQYFKQDFNKGPAFNFKFVLEKASGKYFMWAADDDGWEPEFIRSLVIPMEENACISVSMSGVKRIDEFGNFFDITRFNEFRYEKYNQFKMALYGASHDNITFYMYGLFRLKVIKQFYTNFDNTYGKDLVLICEMLMSTRFYYVDEILHTRNFNIIQGTAERYPDEEIGKNYGDRLKFFRLLFRLGPYLFRSKNIPGYHKIWIPFIVVRFGLWMCQLFYSEILKKTICGNHNSPQ